MSLSFPQRRESGQVGTFLDPCPFDFAQGGLCAGVTEGAYVPFIMLDALGRRGARETRREDAQKKGACIFRYRPRKPFDRLTVL